MLSAISRRLSAARSLCHRIGLDDAGSVVTFMVAVPVLAGVVAVGVETGQLYRVKRQMQISADAAALAASVDATANRTGTVTATALYEAQRNGFTDGVNNVTVTVTSPYNGNSTAAKVEITKANMGFSLGAVFLNLLGKSSPTANMTARAVAMQTSTTTNTTTTTPVTTTTTTNTSDGCIIALTPNAEQGVSITNFNNFGTDCSILSNGTAAGATSSTASIKFDSFNNVTIDSSAKDARIWTRGTLYQPYGTPLPNSHFSADAYLENQTSSIYDPYGTGSSKELGTPSPGSCTYTNYAEPSGGNLTMSPGTYCGGLTVQNKSNVYFTPGTYYVANGDLIIRSDNNVSCPSCGTSNGVTTGVTFVLTQTTGSNSDIGGVSITSENNVTLNAPSTGTYAGVLFYQDRRATAGTMASTSKIFTVASLNNATLSGAVYFPQNRIDISSINNIGGSPTNGCTIWIARYIKFSNFNNNYKGGCSTYGTTPAGVSTTTTTTTNQTTTTTTTKTANKVVWDPT